MDPQIAFSDLFQPIGDALAGLFKDVNTRIKAVQQQNTALQEQYEALRKKHDADINKLQDIIGTILHEHNELEAQLLPVLPVINGMAAGIKSSTENLTPGDLTTSKKLPALQTLSQRSSDGFDRSHLPWLAAFRAQSSATFRAVSQELVDSVGEFDEAPLQAKASAIKRTMSQRHSENGSFEDIPHKRSGSLQRKRGRSDLNKASRESVEKSSMEYLDIEDSDVEDFNATLEGTPQPTSQVQKSVAYAQTGPNQQEPGDYNDLSSEIVVARPKTRDAASRSYLQLPGDPNHSELSPASQSHLRKLGAGQTSAGEMLESIAKAAPPPNSSQRSHFFNTDLKGSPAGRRHSTRDTKKKPPPDGFIDVRTLRNDKKVGLVLKKAEEIGR